MYTHCTVIFIISNNEQRTVTSATSKLHQKRRLLARMRIDSQHCIGMVKIEYRFDIDPSIAKV